MFVTVYARHDIPELKSIKSLAPLL